MARIAEQDVMAEVLRLIEQTLKVPADKVDIDANFETFGINSLIVMELMENIEKEFEVTLTPAQFSNVDSVRGLTELLERLLAESAPAAPASAPVAAAAPAPAVAAQPQASAQQSFVPFAPLAQAQPSRAVPERDRNLDVLNYIRQKYAIELGYREYATTDEIVETMIAGHTADLLRHYGLPVAPAAPATLPAVAIVGISCRLPDAPDHRAFWRNLIEQRNSMREIPLTRWDWREHYADKITPGKTVSKWGALIDDFDCFDAGFFGIPADEAAAMDPQQRLLLEENYRAVEDAGLNMKKLAGSRTGVFVGYEYSEYEQHLRRLNNKDFTKGPLFSSSSPSYYLCNRISYQFDLCGPSESYNMNCASSAVAINRAYHSLLNGESDLALASAVSLNMFAGDYIASSQYGVLSPDGSSGVFDDDANGFTRGEGVAAIVLKRLHDAERDGDRIYGIIRSCHQNYRGAARNISEVKHESIAKALAECYEKAGVDPASIDYIEVDGYATKWADSFEYEGIKGAFAKDKSGKKHVAIGSVKGNIGNVESVSGVTNVIKVALAMRHKTFPATISKKKINGFMDVDNPAHPIYVADREIPFADIRGDEARPIRAGVNSFADSGANVHILVEEYQGGGQVAKEPAAVKRLFVLSAKDPARLEQYIGEYLDFLADESRGENFADMVYTAQVGRDAMSERLAIAATSRKELADKLALVKKNGIKPKLGLESREIYYGSASAGDKNALAGLITAEMATTQLLQSARSSQWKQIALLWVNGVSIPWETIWQADRPNKAELPAYPFARVRHWIDVIVTGNAEAVSVSTATTAPQAEPAAPAPAPSAGEPAQTLYFYLPSDPSAPVDEVAVHDGAEKIAMFLRQEAGRLLEIAADAVAADRNFLELGMNSMNVADLIIRTDSLLGINLSPSVLFKHPEIDSLAGYLAETYADTVTALVVSRTEPSPDQVRSPVASASAPRSYEPADILVPLQLKGDRTPLFAVPGAGSNALSLQQLSQALGNKQPFYCLEAVGLDGSAPAMASVEEIAAFNLRAIREAQARGPYRLLGYSNGGVIAYEMARKLVDEDGENVSLVLVDALSPLLPGKDPVVEMIEVFKHFVESLGASTELEAETLRAVPESERSTFLYEHFTGLGIALPREQFIAHFDAATDSERACQAYVPPKLGGHVEVTLLRATQGYDAPEDYGWNQLLAAPVRVHEIEADHFSIVESGPAREVAKRLANQAGKSGKKLTSRSELEVDAV